MVKVTNNHKKSNKGKPKVESIDLKSHSVQELYEKAIKAYQQNDHDSQNRWNRMLAESGTKKDKISAAGVLILQNPDSSLKYFDMIVKWCFDKNPNFAISAIEALVNVFNEHVFAGKNLNSFVDSVQNYIHEHKKKTIVTQADLVGFYLESQIKQYYSQLIKAIEMLLGDELAHIKKLCIKFLGILARHKQLRRTILALIINKLGDTDMDVVNQVSKSLKDEFYQDILASETLMEETQTFLFRSNLPHKAQFFVINFLNSINLKFLNEKSLNKLFEIFYHFFTKCMSADDSDELASRLFLNSIKGLNRIFSFMKGGSKQTKRVVEQKIEDVYKIVHTTPNTKAKIQLLLFLFQSHAYLHGNLSSNGRFFRVLYEFIGNDDITHSSLSEMFFDLVLVCMKEDQNLNRVLAMSKRMLQLCFGASSNFIVTTLLMLDKVIQSKEGFKIFLNQSENALADEGTADSGYDMNKRDPLFAGAEKTCIWELKTLASHFHPTIRKFSNAIISGQPINYQGSNPLLEFNLTSFIEKMSLKKQRKSDAWKLKVKRNLSKIRSSKYQSLLEKGLEDFKQDEDFIKKYLENRTKIHINRKKIQSNDIEQFADGVIEREMDRLNPKDYDEDLSITPLGSQDQDMGDMNEGQFEEGEQFEQGEQNFDEQNEEFEEGEGEEFGSEDQFNEGNMDEQEQDFDEGQDEAGDEQQFEDVFDQIQEQQEYPKKNKNKTGNKRFGGNKNKQISKKPPKGYKKKPIKVIKKKGGKNQKGNNKRR